MHPDALLRAQQQRLDELDARLARGLRDVVALLEQRTEEMLDIHALMAMACRRALRLAQGVLGTFRQSIDIHLHPWLANFW